VTVWALPLGMLAVGLVAGLVLVLMTRGGGRRDRKAELQADKDSAMDQLRALQLDRAKLDPADFQAQWDKLMTQAASSLRDLEAVEGDGPEIGSGEHAIGAGGRSSWGTVLVALAFFAVLGVGLTQYSAPRLEGGTLTGTDLSGAADRAERLEAAKAAVEANPEDLDALNLLTFEALQAGDLGAAILQLSIGMTGKAIVELDAALESSPGLSKALFWRGLASLRSDDRVTAVDYMEQALEAATTPEERNQATQGLMEARRPPAQVMLRGKLSLDPAATMPSKGVLFVMVRRTAGGGGPPVAAVRLDPRGVPGTYSVTDRDLMMGGAWPEQVWVEARVDTDGNPTTKSEADLVTALIGPFDPKSTGADLVLGGGAAPEPAETSAAPAGEIGGRITVASGTTLPQGGAVFLIVRRSETPAGPPAAAVRLSLSDVPGPFSVGKANLMMGGAWPEQSWLQVRADADGNAMTRTDADVSSAVVGPIAPGTQDVVLELAN
jgi:tetratricopeptide (TPR) repeat protein